MSEKIKVALQPVEKVVRVYSGRPGCACGCRGTYWPEYSDNDIAEKDKQQFKRIHKIFSQNLDKIYTWESSGGSAKDDFACLDTSPNRTFTIYYK